MGRDGDRPVFIPLGEGGGTTPLTLLLVGGDRGGSSEKLGNGGGSLDCEGVGGGGKVLLEGLEVKLFLGGTTEG